MSSTNFIKGVSLGLIVGSAIGVLIPQKRMPNGRSVVSKALKTMGEVIDNITDVVT